MNIFTSILEAASLISYLVSMVIALATSRKKWELISSVMGFVYYALVMAEAIADYVATEKSLKSLS